MQLLTGANDFGDDYFKYEYPSYDDDAYRSILYREAMQ